MNRPQPFQSYARAELWGQPLWQLRLSRRTVPQAHLQAAGDCLPAIAEKYHREKCSREELAQTVERINRQHERTLNHIGVLEKGLREWNDSDKMDEAA